MPIRIPLVNIVVHRADENKGKPFSPKIGEPFNFTAAELEDITKVMPKAVRKPINEAPAAEAPAADAPDAKPAKEPKAETKPAKEPKAETKAGEGAEAPKAGAEAGAGDL